MRGFFWAAAPPAFSDPQAGEAPPSPWNALARAAGAWQEALRDGGKVPQSAPESCLSLLSVLACECLRSASSPLGSAAAPPRRGQGSGH